MGVCGWGEGGHLVTYRKAPLDLPWGLFRDPSFRAAEERYFILLYCPTLFLASTAPPALGDTCFFLKPREEASLAVSGLIIRTKQNRLAKGSTLGRRCPLLQRSHDLEGRPPFMVAGLICHFSCIYAGGFSESTEGFSSHTSGEGS